MTKQVVVTSNIDRLLEYVGFVQPEEERMIAVYGQPGTGKTTAGKWLTKSWDKSKGKVTYMRSTPYLSNYGFAQALCESIGQSESSFIKAMNALTRKLDTSNILVIDECDSLNDKCLEILRTVHDMAGSTIIMIGELSFFNKIAKHSRLFDRTTHCNFGELTLNDAKLLCALACSKVALAEDLIVKAHAEAEGNARRLVKIFGFIHSDCITNGWDTCDLQRWGKKSFRSDFSQLPQFVRGVAA